jgi:hypothetical protein
MSLALEGVCETLGLRLTSVHPDRIVESGARGPVGRDLVEQVEGVGAPQLILFRIKIER